jgi:hypothetical protein
MQDNDALSADEPVRAAPGEDPELRASAEEADGDDTCQIEHEGQVYEVPVALRGAFLRQADYTRKTQELAEHRRALLTERQAVAAQAQAGEGALADRAQQTQALRQQYAYALSHHEARGQLQAAQEAAAKMAETGRTLQQEIEGWSPEVAAKLVDYAKAFGVTHEELTQMADPRLWKVLHKAYQADRANQEEGAANAAAKAQAVRPAVLVSGSAGGGVRDELATKEWMQRRNDIVRKGR